MTAAKNQKAIVHHNKKGVILPEEITELINKAADSFMTAKEFCEKAIEKCREHGIDPQIVGQKLREILLEKGKSLRTIQRMLAPEFKAKPRGATVAGAIGKSLLYSPVCLFCGSFDVYADTSNVDYNSRDSWPVWRNTSDNEPHYCVSMAAIGVWR